MHQDGVVAAGQLAAGMDVGDVAREGLLKGADEAEDLVVATAIIRRRGPGRGAADVVHVAERAHVAVADGKDVDAAGRHPDPRRGPVAGDHEGRRRCALRPLRAEDHVVAGEDIPEARRAVVELRRRHADAAEDEVRRAIVADVDR